MAKKGASKNPPAPDPAQVAAAQSASNIATAEAQQRLNMVGTNGPTGQVSWSADPTQPGGYTQNTVLSPQEQATYDQSKFAENAALGVAGQQIGRVGTALADPLDLDKLPGMSTSYDRGQALKYSFDPGQEVQGSVGGDLEAARRAAEGAVYKKATSRLDPQWQQREDSERVRLANQGLGENSTAYQTAVANMGRERNDAYEGATYASIGAGEDAAMAQFQRQLGQGQFANDAAAQEFERNRGVVDFHNQTGVQDATLNRDAATFGNEARSQALQERAYVQNQPINQFTALMGSGQVGMPEGISYTPSQVAATDVIGANALSVQAQQAAANRSQQQKSGLMSGLMSLGSAAIMASDERLKTDIEPLGLRPDGLMRYAFRYLWSEVRHVGVMAQEVMKVRPDAVRVHPTGFLMVDLARL